MAHLTATRWLADPPDDRVIRFNHDRGSWTSFSYRRLAEDTARAAGAFHAQGVGRGCRVGLIRPTGPAYVAALFGLWSLGAVPCPIAPPAASLRGADYAARLTALTSAAGMTAVSADAEFAPAVREASRGIAVRVLTDLDGDVRTPDPDGIGEVALIQFSSGSSARPRGVVLTTDALSHHLETIAGWLGVSADTPLASWIPLHHDMGMIGCLLTSIAAGSDMWLMRPEQYLRRPLDWLRCFGESGAMMSATTGSGLEHLLRRIDPGDLDGMDFGRWQALVVGAERVRNDVLRRFADLLAPYGHRASSIVPAYGLAEATLAVSGAGRRTPPSALRVDTGHLTIGRPVRAPESEEAGVETVSCGRPLPGNSVRILGDDGTPLPERHLGEIEVSGPAMSAGYAEGGAVPAVEFHGTIATGDAGFLADGEVYVLGRIGDSLSVRGQRVFAEDLELLLHRDLPGLGEPVVLLGNRADEDLAIVLVERGDAAQAERAARLLLPYLPGVSVTVRRTPRKAVLRTTSGKPRRRRMWRDHGDHPLAGTELWPDLTGPDVPPRAAGGAAPIG